MRLLLVSRVVCLPVPLLLVLGCGAREKAPVSTQKKIVEIGELPKLGDPIGPLDEGRVEVSPPEDWATLSRKTGWVIRFKESEKLSYPNLRVTAEDYENIFNVRKDNVDEFAKQIAGALREDESVTKLAEAVTPMEIGGLVGVTYGRRAKDSKDRKVEQRFIETVVAGRKYKIELQARRGTLERYRPHLHAVAGGIKFLKADTAEPPEDASGKEKSEKEKAIEDEIEAELQ